MTSPAYGPGLAPGHFFLPGPVEVHPDVLAAQNHQPIGHRGSGIQKLMECLQAGLRPVFRTERPVYVSTSSATGLMEAAIRNGVRDRVLCLVNGAFSERFAEISELCDRKVTRLEVEWGEAIDPQAVHDALKVGAYDAVTMVHSETSTGVLNDIATLAGVVREFDDTMVLVDSVTGIGGAEFHTDAWGVDFVVTGSHKALSMPPGLAFGVASERLLDRASTIPGRGMYFDLLAFEEQMEKLQTPTTPAVTLLYALAEQLARIAEETMEGRWARHAAMAERTVAWVDETPGVEVFAVPGRRSPTVTCIRTAADDGGPKIVKEMAARGFVIGGGYGKLKPNCFRIGHMGDHTVAELENVLNHLGEVLK